jgi:hypothetical protein
VSSFQSSSLAALLALAAALPSAPPPALAADPVRVVILKEHVVGSAAHAQPYVDKLVAVAAKLNGWPSAEGKFFTRREAAVKYVAESKPRFGMVSLAAFLALRKDSGLAVLGIVDVASAGGRSYHVISREAAELAACKGKTLASDHADDPRFIERVVADGAFKLGDFKLIETQRPVQTIKKVTSGEAVCALVDDAQLRELAHIDGAAGVREVWKSKTLPPMAVVAFAGASAPEREKFRSSLSAICTGDGKSHCDKVGIRELKPAGEDSYAEVTKKYGD